MKNAIRYKITVEAIVERVKNGVSEWTTIGQELIEGTDKLKSVYGYTPPIDRVVKEEIKIFEQAVDTLDMAALVSVVNRLPTNAGGEQ